MVQDAEVPVERVAVCHPHPSYGGSPSNYPIVVIAQAVEAVGVPSVRPALRETDGVADLRNALDGIPSGDAGDDAGGGGGGGVLAAGWSFGADTCIGAAAVDDRIVAIALVAPTFRFCTDEAVAAVSDATTRGHLRVLVLEPSRDQVTAPGTARARLANATVETIDGCDHFLAGYEGAIAERIAAFTRELRR